MNKQEVEQILIIVRADSQEALHIKIYKDGTLYRKGCGGLPEVGFAGASHTNSPALFDQLMAAVPQPILDNPLQYRDEAITTPLEYIVTFYGVSKNGATGETAEWTKSTGIHLQLDSSLAIKHAMLSFADTFTQEALEKTNSWYFDVVINAVYKLRSNTLPETTITAPAASEIQAHYDSYVNQVRNSTRKWDITSFTNNKTYTDTHGSQFAPFATATEEVFKLRFIPTGGGASQPTQGGDADGKWWKVW